MAWPITDGQSEFCSGDLKTRHTEIEALHQRDGICPSKELDARDTKRYSWKIMSENYIKQWRREDSTMMTESINILVIYWLYLTSHILHQTLILKQTCGFLFSYFWEKIILKPRLYQFLERHKLLCSSQADQLLFQVYWLVL